MMRRIVVNVVFCPKSVYIYEIQSYILHSERIAEHGSWDWKERKSSSQPAWRLFLGHSWNVTLCLRCPLFPWVFIVCPSSFQNRKCLSFKVDYFWSKRSRRRNFFIFLTLMVQPRKMIIIKVSSIIVLSTLSQGEILSRETEWSQSIETLSLRHSHCS